MNKLRHLIAAGLIVFAAGHSSAQQAMPSQPVSESAQNDGENGKDTKKTIDLSANYYADANADISGGSKRGPDYLGRVGILLDADLEKLLGLRGTTAHISVHDIHGVGLSGSRLGGNLLIVSGIEAEPAQRLNQAWLQTVIARGTTLRIGKFAAATEFMVSSTANLFVNSTFGWPGSFAADLPSGGPAWPLAGPGTRLAVKAGKRTLLQVAVFSGDPAGAGSGDPQRRDNHGFNSFNLAGKPFVIAQVGFDSGTPDPSLKATVGTWVHFDRFADLSDSNSTPGPIGGTAGLSRNVGVYGVADARVWRSPSNARRQVNGFARVSFSPPDRNVVDLYVDGGVALDHPFGDRDSDKIGFAVAVARVSPRLRSAARRRAFSGQATTEPPAFEAVAELSYKVAIIGPLSLQPNLQYVLHPAGSAFSIQTPEGRVANALVLGVRSATSF